MCCRSRNPKQDLDDSSRIVFLVFPLFFKNREKKSVVIYVFSFLVHGKQIKRYLHIIILSKCFLVSNLKFIDVRKFSFYLFFPQN
jgi:hypothetical protein